MNMCNYIYIYIHINNDNYKNNKPIILQIAYTIDNINNTRAGVVAQEAAAGEAPRHDLNVSKSIT